MISSEPSNHTLRSFDFQDVENSGTPFLAEDDYCEEKVIADLKDTEDKEDVDDSDTQDTDEDDEAVPDQNNKDTTGCPDENAKIVTGKSQRTRKWPQFGSGRKICFSKIITVYFFNRSKTCLDDNYRCADYAKPYVLSLTMRQIWPARKPRLKNHSGRMIWSMAEFVGSKSRLTETAILFDYVSL